MSTLIDEEWAVITSFLPEGWRELARETGAIRRERGIADPDILLRVILLHVGGGLSLRSATARAAELGIVEMSDVALLKRLRSSEEWLRTLAARLFTLTRFSRKAGSLTKERRFRAFDATTIEEPGATGTDWRVHFGLSLPELRCDFYSLTSTSGGETFTRFPVERGDVILADRGYSHRRGVAHVIEAGGDVVVRLNSTSFPLLEPSGRPFDLLGHLRQLRGVSPDEWQVVFEYKKKRYPMRLCALRKSQTAAERAKRKLRRRASKQGQQLQPGTLEAAEYVYVLTSLAKKEHDAAAILELYRARWQLELVFKRMKSLMRLGHLPKHSEASSRAWIEGKLLSVLLIERLLTSAASISPWGYDYERTNT